jgi:hypothetical protein
MPRKTDPNIRGNPKDTKINGASSCKNFLFVILSFTKGLGHKPISASWAEEDEPRITSNRYVTTRTSKITKMIVIAEKSTLCSHGILLSKLFLASFFHESTKKSLFAILVALSSG